MNRKKIILIFGTLLVLIAIAGFFIIKSMKESQDNTIAEEYTPQEEIAENQVRQTIVSLYFPSKENGEITPEARLVDIKEIINVPYEKLFNMLSEGPKNEKLEKFVPKNTKVLKAYMDKDCLVLDLSKDFLNYDMEKENSKINLINCIVKTMTELIEVDKVKFLIEGTENENFSEVYLRT